MSEERPLHAYRFTCLEDNSDRGYIFNTSKFHSGRSMPGKFLNFMVLNTDDEPVARFGVTVVDNQAFSPWKSPFGSIEPLKEFDLAIIEDFVNYVLEMLSTRGINYFEVISFPRFYDPEVFDQMDLALSALGFEKTAEELCQYLNVSEKDFESGISYAERKRLNKCRRNGFHAKIESISSLNDAYNLIKSSRARKGYPVTMELVDLRKMFETFPDRYLLFASRIDNKLAAIAVSILVTDAIMYNFYHADHVDYLKFSPTVMVVESVYRYCQEHGVKFLDLGISSLDGELNEGIFKFKRGLGAKESIKCKYGREI